MIGQQGSGALAMVVVILLLGTALLNATRQQLSTSLTLVADERQHIIDFHQAQAALRWGMQQNWQPASGWQCKSYAQQQWRACLYARDDKRWLLRGESGAVTHQPVVLWQWIRPVTSGSQQLIPFIQGWLDFCPLADSAKCLSDAP